MKKELLHAIRTACLNCKSCNPFDVAECEDYQCGYYDYRFGVGPPWMGGTTKTTTKDKGALEWKIEDGSGGQQGSRSDVSSAEISCAAENITTSGREN